MSLKDFLILAILVSLVLTVFGFGLRARSEDVLYLCRRPGLLLRSLLAMFVIMPITALALVRVIDAPRMVEVVLVALAISPIPPLLPKKVSKAGGATGYVLGLLVTVALLSLIVVPLWVYVLGRYLDRPLLMPIEKIAGTVFRIIILPILAGLGVRWFFPDFAARIERPAQAIGGLLLAAGVLVLVGVSLPSLWNLMESRTIGLFAAFIGVALLVGHLLGGPGIEHEGVLALSTATRHPGIAFALASANFPEERFGGIIILYLIFAAILCIPYIKWQTARGGREIAEWRRAHV